MKRLVVGDVFIIPTGDGRAGVGQLVAKSGIKLFYYAIFEQVFSLEEAPHKAVDALSAPILFLVTSMDVKISVGDWTVVARAPVRPKIPFPAYRERMGLSGRVDVVDYSGTRRRPATAREVDLLPDRITVAPARLESGLCAWLGLKPWIDKYDELRINDQTTTAKMFGCTEV